MNNNSSRAGQWIQHSGQHQIQELSPCFDDINMMSTSVSSLGEHGGIVAAHETAGRRSRASRRAVPTTLLNANPSNFRALVQKFTGRSSGGEANRRRGPVTLDFGSPTTISKEAIFPVSGDRKRYDHDHVLNQHVSNEPRHVTWLGTEPTTTYQLGEESNSVFDQQDHDLLREYSGNSSYDDGLDHVDYYYHDFHQGTETLEEFMMSDLDL
ncbi:unnamed protein product [Brassica oleracea var. botrytis]|uniref:VQ domain-containing protein n=2 Tax=Brassica TaxID=3705 RepID=A0A3P6G3U3_BRAOL|nr:uncharacterized protein LOC106373427 [Brassica napus]KAH0901697.1 hypothetical protein HID58_041200 [Brassica napus]CAF2069992.1 unnamed protein product [Brassica napus]VDD48979.1 unnamed protein product [Brassica oleracea]